MTAPIDPDLRSLAGFAHNENPLSPELRLPSPQRGREAGGEGNRELVGICYPCDIRPTSLENPIQRGGGAEHWGGTVFSSNVEPQGRMKTFLTFKAKMTQRVTPPHPQPLSRAGERGGEGSTLPPIKWRLADVSTRARMFRARILGACLCILLFEPSPAALSQAKKTDKPTEQPGSKKPQPAVERQPQVQKVFAIKHGDVDAIAQTLRIFPADVRPNRELRVIGVSTPAALMPTIEENIRRLDVPTPQQNVEVTVYLLLASDQIGSNDSTPSELETVTKQLKATFAFKAFRTIDTLVLRSREKLSAHAKGLAKLDLEIPNPSPYSFGYHRATIMSDDKGRSIRLDGLSFNAQVMVKKQQAEGSAVIAYETIEAGFGTNVDVHEGQKVVVGKAAVGGTNSALILVITAKILE